MADVAIESAPVPALWTGAEEQTFTEFMKSHMWVSLMDFIPVAQRAAIRAYTSTFNCAPAWAEAVAALGTKGGGIFAPAGLYNFSSTIHLHKRIYLLGEGGGFYDDAEFITRFVFAANLSGFVVHHRNTDETGIAPTPSPANPAGTRVEGIYFKGSGTTGYGFWMRSTAFLRDCTIDGFGQNNIQIRASVNWTLGGNTDETLFGSANSFMINNVWSVNSGGSGLYVFGQDVNAGCIVGLRCHDNAVDGIHDESFLGNHYFGCETSGNARSYYLNNAAAAGGLWGCKSGDTETAASISSRQMVVGGNVEVSSNAMVGDFDFGTWTTPNGFIINQSRVIGGFSCGTGTTPNRTILNVMKSTSAPLALHREGDHNDGYRFAVWDTTAKTWDRMHGTTVVEKLTTTLSSGGSTNPKDETGTAIATDHLVYPRGVYLPSLHDASEYRLFRFEAGDKAAASYSTASNITYTAADILSGAIMRDCGGGNRSDTLPSAALLVAAIANTAAVSQIITCKLSNTSDADETITLLAGSGVSFDANQTAASRVVEWKSDRILRIRITSVTSGSEAYQIVM